jgi:hypothetical protein
MRTPSSSGSVVREHCSGTGAGTDSLAAETTRMDELQQCPAALRWRLLRPRLRACPSQRRRRSRGTATPSTWALGEPPAFAPRGYSCEIRLETRKARKEAPPHSQRDSRAGRGRSASSLRPPKDKPPQERCAVLGLTESVICPGFGGVVRSQDGSLRTFESLTDSEANKVLP